MKRINDIVIATCFATSVWVAIPPKAFAEKNDLTTMTAKRPTKAQIEAYKTKCSRDADVKGLTSGKDKSEERKAFRATCIKKLIGGN